MPLVLADETVLPDIELDFLRHEVIEAPMAEALRFDAPAPGPDTTARALHLELSSSRMNSQARRGDCRRGRRACVHLCPEDARGAPVRSASTAGHHPPAAGVGPAALELLGRRFRAQLQDTRRLLGRQVADGRQILRQVLDGRLVFTPRREALRTFYEFSGTGWLGRVISGVI